MKKETMDKVRSIRADALKRSNDFRAAKLLEAAQEKRRLDIEARIKIESIKQDDRNAKITDIFKESTTTEKRVKKENNFWES